MNGANADPNSNEGKLWCQMNQMAVNMLTAPGNDVPAPYSPLSMVEKIEKAKDLMAITFKLDMSDLSYQIWAGYIQTSLQGYPAWWAIMTSSSLRPVPTPGNNHAKEIEEWDQHDSVLTT